MKLEQDNLVERPKEKSKFEKFLEATAVFFAKGLAGKWEIKFTWKL